MNSIRLAVIGAAMTALAGIAHAQAPATATSKTDAKEARDLRRDRHDIGRDRRDMKKDVHEIQAEKRALIADIKEGENKDAKKDLSALRADELALRKDRRGIAKDKRDLTHDRRDRGEKIKR